MKGNIVENTVKEFKVILPTKLIQTDIGIKIYDNIKTIECCASDIKEVYLMFPTALDVQRKNIQKEG